MKIAQDYLRDEPAFLTSQNFGPFVRQGMGSGPSVLIGDQVGISLIVPGTSPLDYRMALLAHPGDMVLVRQRVPEFERYLADYLDLDGLQFVQATLQDLRPVAAQACQNPNILETLCHLAVRGGGLTLKSYLTSGHDWRLAQSIGETIQRDIHVCGPAPRVVRRANDKLWFSRLAARTIGRHATPPTNAAFGPAATAGLVQRLSRLSPQVIVKIPDSAGSAGNIRLDSRDIAGMSLGRLRQFLLERLHRTGWHDRYPLLVGVWDQNVQCSPSVQLWVPLPEDGAPRVDGILEQRVKGVEGTFVGAASSTLPRALQIRLATQACEIATVLQRLGYFGRCSLDAVICEEDVIHWIECNGRWGGVSIPLTATKQILPEPAVYCLLIVQEKMPSQGMDTAGMIRQLHDLLFRLGSRSQGVIIISPPETTDQAVLNLVAVSQIQEDAEALMAEAMARLRRTT